MNAYRNCMTLSVLARWTALLLCVLSAGNSFAGYYVGGGYEGGAFIVNKTDYPWLVRFEKATNYFKGCVPLNPNSVFTMEEYKLIQPGEAVQYSLKRCDKDSYGAFNTYVRIRDKAQNPTTDFRWFIGAGSMIGPGLASSSDGGDAGPHGLYITDASGGKQQIGYAHANNKGKNAAGAGWGNIWLCNGRSHCWND